MTAKETRQELMNMISYYIINQNSNTYSKLKDALNQHGAQLCKEQIELDKKALLKQLIPCLQPNSYPMYAVSEETILSLDKLTKQPEI